MLSYLDQILDCFASMDIEGLRMYLKDEYEYQKASKEVFLNRIEEIFEKMNLLGDSSLKVFPGACCHSGCNPEMTRAGYRFIGDVTHNFFDLRFIIAPRENDQVKDITEIFNCNYFLTNENTRELGERFEVLIFKDEELDFHSTPEHLIYTDQAIRAQSELVSIPIQTIDWEYALSWLFRHKQTFNYVYENDNTFEVSKWTKFKFTYRDLEEVIEIFQKLAQFEIFKFSSLQIEENEVELISVILKIEEILDSSLMFFRKKIEFNNLDYYWNFRNEFYLIGELISEVGRWMDEWFYPTQKMLVEKYFALSEGEIDKIIELDYLEETDLKLDLLFTHMGIRKKAELIGEWIPYYLRKENA